MARFPLMSGRGRLLAEADAGWTLAAALVGGCATPVASDVDGCDLLQPKELAISSRVKTWQEKRTLDFILSDIVNGNSPCHPFPG
jgi:hypothetical protein